MNWVGVALVVIVLVAIASRVGSFGSIAGAYFGAKVASTIGKTAGANGLQMPVEVRVHRLDSVLPYKAIGVEIVTKTIGTYRVSPVTLSTQQARELAAHLLRAAGDERDVTQGLARSIVAEPARDA